MVGLTKHLLDFNHPRNLSRLSGSSSIASHDPELVLGSLGHVGERILADLGRSGVALGPFHLVHLLHLDEITCDH